MSFAAQAVDGAAFESLAFIGPDFSDEHTMHRPAGRDRLFPPRSMSLGGFRLR